MKKSLGIVFIMGVLIVFPFKIFADTAPANTAEDDPKSHYIAIFSSKLAFNNGSLEAIQKQIESLPCRQILQKLSSPLKEPIDLKRPFITTQSKAKSKETPSVFVVPNLFNCNNLNQVLVREPNSFFIANSSENQEIAPDNLLFKINGKPYPTYKATQENMESINEALKNINKTYPFSNVLIDYQQIGVHRYILLNIITDTFKKDPKNVVEPILLPAYGKNSNLIVMSIFNEFSPFLKLPFALAILFIIGEIVLVRRSKVL